MPGSRRPGARHPGPSGITSVFDHAAGAPPTSGRSPPTPRGTGPGRPGVVAGSALVACLLLAARPFHPRSRSAARATVQPAAVDTVTHAAPSRPAAMDPALVPVPHRHSRGSPSCPPMPMVALIEFAKGGYLLAYLPAAVIALLLSPAPSCALNRPATDRSANRVLAPIWLTVATVPWGPSSWSAPSASSARDRGHPDPVVTRLPVLWLDEARYQAPYADTFGHPVHGYHRCRTGARSSHSVDHPPTSSSFDRSTGAATSTETPVGSSRPTGSPW